jgi:hypothetical protein
MCVYNLRDMMVLFMMFNITFKKIYIQLYRGGQFYW